MPRKNRRKTEPLIHAPSIYGRGFRANCIGCAFYGAGWICLTSDSKCLKAPLPKLKEVDDAENIRRTNTASTKC